MVLSGCYTISETEYPEVKVTPVPAGKTIAVKLFSFRTGVYNYVSVKGHETMNGTPEKTESDGSKHIDTTRGLESSASGKIVVRAMDELKRLGWTIDKKNPQYVIHVDFDGPVLPENDLLGQFGWMFCTLFTAEKNEVTWTAKLRVLDGKDMTKVLFTKDYVQNYSTTVWGPIPVASPACHPMVTEHAGSSWAITALADVALADATAFIVKNVK